MNVHQSSSSSPAPMNNLQVRIKGLAAIGFHLLVPKNASRCSVFAFGVAQYLCNTFFVQ